ncbi:MAG TPA: hypothetical protein VIM09_07435 [Chthoniobacterales bacterium]
MSTPQEKANPTDAEEKATKSEVEGRKAKRDTTTVPQDGVAPDTSVPQDDT